MAARLYLYEEAVAEEMRERAARRHQVREDSLELPIPDREFVNTFRVTPEVFDTLCSEIVPLLPPKKNSRGIDPTEKIMIALKFLGRGDYQTGVGRDETIPMAQQTVSKCLSEVVTALNNPEFVCRHVRFPQNSTERTVIKMGFYNSFGMPGVCGAIDCTHVALVCPEFHEERYFNRKHFHSLNVQVICDANNIILNVDATYGGANHDSFVWHQSEIRPHMKGLCVAGETAVLLGDSGYPLREYLMTPVSGASEDSPEGRYNATQMKARSTIERTFGILKGRWRCLLAARELYYDPEKAGQIVIACSVLHNMCVKARIDPIELEPNELQVENELQRAAESDRRMASVAHALRRGREARDRLIRNYFS